ncbi:(2Fe-2S)-binding protein [Chloroflexi bacterium TSY]|nr:(2Fe-2S)-binding protein [Chloroflexi bacterium TSY]
MNDSFQSSRLHSRGESFEIIIDGEAVSAYAGETVAALLMTLGRRTFTQPSHYNLPRTLYCAMGVCHQCLVTVNQVRDIRACMTTVEPGMTIETHK